MISRRRFLQAGATGTLTVLGARRLFAEEKASPTEGAAVLVDLTRCIGCRACENACLVRWGFPALPPATIGYGAGDGKLTFRTRTFVDFPNDPARPPPHLRQSCVSQGNPAFSAGIACHRTRTNLTVTSDQCGYAPEPVAQGAQQRRCRGR